MQTQQNNPLQGTEEWLQERLGRFTASEIHRLMGDCKREMTEEELKAWKEANPRSTAKQCVDPTLLSSGALTYVMEVASERLTGRPAKQEFENDAMRWGKMYEPVAKQLYESVFDVRIDNVPFIPYLEYGGASPDGLIGSDIGCEFKCPISPAVHLQYRSLLDADDLKTNYPNHYWQCLKGMFTTRRKLWKFISFHPHYDALKQLKIIDVPWVEEDIQLLYIKLTAAEKACQFLLTI